MAGDSAAARGACVWEPTQEPVTLVIFGASGDLTRRKLVPALLHLAEGGLLPPWFRVVGAARTEWSDEDFRDACRSFLTRESGLPDRNAWDRFAARLHYVPCAYGSTDAAAYGPLFNRLSDLEADAPDNPARLFYLAIPPKLYETVITGLGSSAARNRGATRRVVIEKPFGRDLDTARNLDVHLRRYFKEEEIFRIDHYLAKETVQNILLLRFANEIFEPLWNHRYIEQVQITAAETLGVEHRAGYYEQAGVFRDMFQNHILQLLALTAMEAPSKIEADHVRNEKVKVFESIRPIDLNQDTGDWVLGQYEAGSVGGRDVPAYREEAGVAPDSRTGTYGALRLYVDNWRWKGVPFLLRSGKCLSRRLTEIAVRFRNVPHMMFRSIIEDRISPNTLVMRIQPDEGVSLTFQAKQPGPALCLRPVTMSFRYADHPADTLKLDAYERALVDCIAGDQMLFVRSDGVDAAWRLLTPLLRRLDEDRVAPRLYPAGTDGPEEANRLVINDGGSWRALRPQGEEAGDRP